MQWHLKITDWFCSLRQPGVNPHAKSNAQIHLARRAAGSVEGRTCGRAVPVANRGVFTL